MSNETQTNRRFLDFLVEFRRGLSVIELSEELARVTEAALLTGKSATLVYRIHIAPAAKGNGLAVAVTDDINSKLPKGERDGSIFFVTPEGGLSRNDPGQQEMSFTVIKGQQTEEPEKEQDHGT